MRAHLQRPRDAGHRSRRPGNGWRTRPRSPSPRASLGSQQCSSAGPRRSCRGGTAVPRARRPGSASTPARARRSGGRPSRRSRSPRPDCHGHRELSAHGRRDQSGCLALASNDPGARSSTSRRSVRPRRGGSRDRGRPRLDLGFVTVGHRLPDDAGAEHRERCAGRGRDLPCATATPAWSSRLARGAVHCRPGGELDAYLPRTRRPPPPPTRAASRSRATRPAHASPNVSLTGTGRPGAGPERRRRRRHRGAQGAEARGKPGGRSVTPLSIQEPEPGRRDGERHAHRRAERGEGVRADGPRGPGSRARTESLVFPPTSRLASANVRWTVTVSDQRSRRRPGDCQSHARSPVA